MAQKASESWNEFFIYDPDVPGCLRWKVDRFAGRHYTVLKAAAGSVAGGISDRYYAVRLNGVLYASHRVVWEMHNGVVPDGFLVDHEDGNGLRNQINNLRLTTQLKNMRNRAQQSNNTSGVTGVTYSERERAWRAHWTDRSGKRRSKNFPGEDAFRRACAYRTAMIEQLNAGGAGYTARHGT